MKILQLLPVAGAALVFLGWAGEAAASVSFCFNHNSQYTDSGDERVPSCTSTGTCEDVWTSDAPRPARGILARVIKGGQTKYFYTEDSGSNVGCTPAYSYSGGDAGNYVLTVYSQSLLSGDLIRVGDDSGSVASQTTLVNRTGSGQTTHTFTGSGTSFDRFNVLSAASEAASRLPADTPFDFRVGPLGCGGSGGAGGSCYQSSSENIYIDTSNGTELNKFYIAHEMGHAVMHATRGVKPTSNCSFTGIACGSFGSHAMGSREYSSCAFGEGFAHFYSAMVWNDQLDNDCNFTYWAPNNSPVDCEFGDSAYPLRQMENECSPSFTGKGSEVDWMRALWDYYQNSSPAPRPDFDGVLDFVAAMPNWSATDAWPKSEDGADEVGTSVRWGNAGWLNGIDH